MTLVRLLTLIGHEWPVIIAGKQNVINQLEKIEATWLGGDRSIQLQGFVGPSQLNQVLLVLSKEATSLDETKNPEITELENKTTKNSRRIGTIPIILFIPIERTISLFVIDIQILWVESIGSDCSSKKYVNSLLFPQKLLTAFYSIFMYNWIPTKATNIEYHANDYWRIVSNQYYQLDWFLVTTNCDFRESFEIYAPSK